jgi:hypothetical protein
VIAINEGVELNYGQLLLTILIIPFLSFVSQLQSNSRPLAPSSHKRMRYMPFWCTCNHITQKVGEWKDQRWKSGKYDREWYATPFKEPSVVSIFPKSDNMGLGCVGWSPR